MYSFIKTLVIHIMKQKFNEVKKKENPLKIALGKCEAAFKITFVFAFVIYLPMLKISWPGGRHQIPLVI